MKFIDRVQSGRFSFPISRSLTIPACLAASIVGLLATSASAQIQFEDVSLQTNMTGFTESWGASIGDGNGDNCPDLYINGHRDYPRYYRNTCDGSFENIAYEVDPGNWIDKPTDDKHGAAWADFDNDGDEDLLQSVSITGSALLLVNENGRFVERAGSVDLASDSSGRMPIWFDYNRDGYLDVAQTYTRNSLLRRRDPTGELDFDNDKSGTGFDCPGRIDYGQMLDIDNDGILEFICAEVPSFPNRVFDVSTRPFTNVTSSIPVTSLVNDSVVADFNNDLLTDMVLIRGLQRPSGAAQVNSRRIESWLRTSPLASPDKGFSFSAPGEITVTVDHRGGGILGIPDVIVLDSEGDNSASAGPVDIRYGQGRWAITIENDDESQAYIRVDTEANITGFTETGIDPSEGPHAMRHLVNSPSGLNIVANTGLSDPVRCVSAAAGDFNNDMWVDLYLVCRDGPSNIANLVYENRGNGTFQLVTDHGGEGPVGTGFDVGVGENVVVFDYDGDGLLDLSVLNGLLFYPVGLGGPDTLLRNTTNNGNHWLEIDLRGTVSNRDGLGAKVFVTAGGLTQLREQSGGYHRSSQNHQRLHFGLGGNLTANVRVEWPSGAVTTFQNVQADQLYEIGESGSLTVQTFGPSIHTQLEPGDECGAPPYNIDYGPALLMWRDCPGWTWHFRAKGGRENQQQLFTTGTITADTPFGNVSGHQLNAGDMLDNTGTQIAFSIRVWFTNDKGFNFDSGGQSSACFELSRQDIGTLIVGASRKRLYHSFDLFSLDECEGEPPPPPDDPECGEPVYDRMTEPGLYAWRDCSFSGTAARWTFRAVGGGRAWDEYAGTVTSNVTLTATSSGLSGTDFVDSSPGDGIIDYSLFVGGGGQDTFQIDVPANSQTCFESSAMPTGVMVQLGAGRQEMSGPFDLLTLEACSGLPPPEPDPACGQPAFDRTTEVGVFIWRNCEASGPNTEWHARFAAGGSSWSAYEGIVTSDMPLTASGIGVVSPDQFDAHPDDGAVEFTFWVGGSGIDGFDLEVADGSQTCFAVDQLKPGAQIQLGEGRQVMPASFDLATLGSCN